MAKGLIAQPDADAPPMPTAAPPSVPPPMAPPSSGGSPFLSGGTDPGEGDDSAPPAPTIRGGEMPGHDPHAAGHQQRKGRAAPVRGGMHPGHHPKGRRR